VYRVRPLLGTIGGAMKIHIDTVIDLPEWANWKATDEDGTVWIFEHEPRTVERGGFCIASRGRARILISLYKTVENWRETKVKLR
jgi:hypothetical protein